MYREFFGLRIKPFELTPDSSFLYLSHELREVLSTLKYGIVQRRGFMLLVGEPGTGKTTLINSLIDLSGIDAKFAYIFNPDLNFNELLHTILIEFDLASANEDLSKIKAMHRLKTFVGEQSEKEANAVIVVDEAQGLDIKTLEKLRLLSNVETRKQKLIQIVLSGQPELENTLSHQKLTQLVQRIGLRCRTQPLNEKDAYKYIDHRLKVAGYNGPQLFANKARYLIWTYSKGTPRTINMMCDHCLLTGYARNQKRIDSSIVKEVIDDLDNVPLQDFDYPQGKSKDTIREISQTPLDRSDEIGEVSPKLSEKIDQDRFDMIDELRMNLSHIEASEPVGKKRRRFSAAWIAVIAGVAIVISIFVLFPSLGSFKESKNEFSSKLEAMKNNSQSQLGGTENSMNKVPSGVKPTIDKRLTVNSPAVEDDKEENTVVVNKGETLNGMILRVYGKADPKVLDAILEINPEIKNPDVIFENQAIKLPDKADFD
jgi:type II secretory pathway predicted ATPase ExeA